CEDPLQSRYASRVYACVSGLCRLRNGVRRGASTAVRWLGGGGGRRYGIEIASRQTRPDPDRHGLHRAHGPRLGSCRRSACLARRARRLAPAERTGGELARQEPEAFECRPELAMSPHLRRVLPVAAVDEQARRPVVAADRG